MNFEHIKRLCCRQRLLAPAFVTLICALVYALDDFIAPALSYTPEAISQLELWRLITCHLPHTNIYHFLMNTGAVAALWLVSGHNYSIKNYGAAFIFISLGCALMLYVLAPDVSHYVGLSGVLHGIAMYYALIEAAQRDRIGYLLVLGIAMKLAYEQFFGASDALQQSIQARVIIDAHLYGAIMGVVWFIISIRLSSLSHQPEI